MTMEIGLKEMLSFSVSIELFHIMKKVSQKVTLNLFLMQVGMDGKIKLRVLLVLF